MHYFEQNIGDHAARTIHLSWIEDEALRRMKDHYFLHEQPLPLDSSLLCRKIRARKPTEIAAVRRILEEFFTKTEKGWINSEFDAAIVAFHATKHGAKYGPFCREWKRLHGHRPAPSREVWEKNPGHYQAMISRSSTDDQPMIDGGSTDHPTINQEPRTKNHQPSTIGDPIAVAAVEVDHALLEAPPETGKKERCAEVDVWLDVDSDEARRVINRALGREERRAFTGSELHALGIYAGQHDGQISAAGFDTLKRYLLAEPRYDCRDQRLMDAVPDGSLLRKRRRFGSAVLEDLPNQLEHATRWMAEGQKKETGAGLKSEPGWNWRGFAKSRLGMETDLPWRVLLARHKQEILNAWASTDETQKAEFEALATT